MKKKQIAAALAMILAAALFIGCGASKQSQDISAAADVSSETTGDLLETSSAETTTEIPEEAKEEKAALPDGIYLAEFDTDSSMFRVNETCDGKGTLTVQDGKMMIHISLGSKKIVNLYPGLAEDAAKEGAELLMPTVDTVTYSDGLSDEVYGFDVPVPVLGEEFDLALIGTKGKWYDHKVIVSDPQPLPEEEETEVREALEDGSYQAELTFEGGSGKAKILSPVTIMVEGDQVTATLRWNSPNYDYMIVDGEKYLPVNEEGDSVFQVPVSQFDVPVTVIGDTVAMSKPHEIEYTITIHSDTIKPAPEGLVLERSMELSYAEHFSVDYYKGGYRLLSISDGKKLFVVPEGKEVPNGLEPDVVILKEPVKNLYLVSSAVMDMFRALDALDTIRLSGQKEEGWYIEEAKKAMEQGKILYAGKYNNPDYERILSENTTLAIENRMITHAPEVLEMLERFGIPAMIEYSSYESHPLGRVEWIKFFGALLGKEEAAKEAFDRQETILEAVTAEDKTDKTVAFFFITSNGLVQVRQSSDYIPKLIELAGGQYVFGDLGDPDSGRSTMNMQIEEFYAGARDADILIYNSSIDGGVRTLEELLEKCPVLEDFQAVQTGNIWCTTNDMYQQSMSIGYLLKDIGNVLRDPREEEMEYLFRLK